MTTNPFYRTERRQIYIPSRSGRLGGGTWIDEPDPFGRLLEPSVDEEHLDIRDPFTLSGPVGRRGGNVREDVGKIECLLRLAGVHDLDPTDGPTGYFGTRLEEAVKAFQKGHGLRTDGEINPGGETLKALAQTLQGMGRHGDTVLAHLTPGEAQFLHDITDGGSLNPMTGLVEFYYSNDGRSDYGELESMEALGGSGSDVDSGPESGGKREGGHPGWGMAPIGPTPPSPPSSSNRNDREGGHPGWGMGSSGPTPSTPSAASERTYDDEITRRERLRNIEARRRERNKPNLLEETPRSTVDPSLEHDDQHLNFVDPFPDPTDPNRKEPQEPVNSKRQIKNIFEHHRKLEEERNNAALVNDQRLVEQQFSKSVNQARLAEQAKKAYNREQRAKYNAIQAANERDREMMNAAVSFIDRLFTVLSYAARLRGPNIAFDEDSLQDFMNPGKDDLI